MNEQEIREAAQRIGVIGRKMAQDMQDGIRRAFKQIAQDTRDGYQEKRRWLP